MAEQLTYEMIWQVWQKEKNSGELQPIPKTFYTDCQKFVSETKPADGFETTDTKQNTERLVKEIIAKRKQKILIALAYNKQTIQTEIPQEISFYNSVKETINKHEFRPETQQQKKELIAISDIPQIILPSGARLGPFKKGQTINTESQKDTDYLIENTICETA
jgi:DNA replication initiation complex subunit (GINS family)